MFVETCADWRRRTSSSVTSISVTVPNVSSSIHLYCAGESLLRRNRERLEIPSGRAPLATGAAMNDGMEWDGHRREYCATPFRPIATTRKPRNMNGVSRCTPMQY